MLQLVQRDKQRWSGPGDRPDPSPESLVFTINQKRIDGMGFNYFAKAFAEPACELSEKGNEFLIRAKAKGQ